MAHMQLIRNIKQQLKAQANPTAAIKMQAYMKSAMPYYGVKTPALRTICRDSLARYALDSFQQWHDSVLTLWRNAKYREERHCAIALCEAKQYQVYQTVETLPLYEELIVTGAWWDYVDVIASHRIRYLLRQFSKVLKPVLKDWAKNDDIWLRRASILAQLNLKQETDLRLLYACIKPSLGSDEFFLQKAIGWALRSYAWYDIGEVMHYIEQHKTKLSQLTIREALKNKGKLLA